MIWRLLGGLLGVVLAIVLSTLGVIALENLPRTDDWGSGWLLLIAWLHAIPVGALAGYQVVRHWQLIYRRRAILIAVGAAVFVFFVHEFPFWFSV